jgi:hypothetical protein
MTSRQIKTPPTHWVRGDQFATLAVIGTLRPTDRRRAFIYRYGKKYTNACPKMLREWS